MSGSPARVDVIDGLRACAILGVVSLHLLGIAGFLEAGTTKSLLAADRSSGRGPQTAMEAALADRGQLLPTDRDVYSLGVARMPVRLNQIGPGPPALLDPLPTPSDQQYARLAARDAGTGKLFIVAPAGDTFAQQSAPGGALAAFMSALESRCRLVETRDFPGLYIFGLAVHMLECGPSATKS
jgi:hypothetical protein